MRALVIVAAALSAAGCYRYTPMAAPMPDAGMDVRVELTDAGAVQLAPAIGQRVESIDGKSVTASDSSLVLSVAATISRSGDVAHWNNERIDVPRSAIARIRGRQLDTRRTVMVSALTVVGAFVVGKIFGLDVLGLDGLRSGGSSGGKQ